MNIPSFQHDIMNLSCPELIKSLELLSEKPFRAQQIFDWIYQKGATQFDEMKNLSGELRLKLKKEFQFPILDLVQKNASSDGTIKFLFALSDQERIETVMIPTSQRATVCVSTQAGCKYACRFCASGLGGWKRNLSCSEILRQICYVKKQAAPKMLTHIVFMGIGEPLDNYDNLLKAIRIINSKEALEIGARRITISTCGLIDQIKRLAQENMQFELAVSLHGSNNQIRNTLMPVNQRYPLKELIKTCDEYSRLTSRQVTFEYMMIKDLTCTPKAAQELGQLLKGMLCKLNLITFNKVKEFGYEPPTAKEVLEFEKSLAGYGILSTLRRPRGQDIQAACGQLRQAAT